MELFNLATKQATFKEGWDLERFIQLTSMITKLLWDGRLVPFALTKNAYQCDAIPLVADCGKI